MLLGEKCRQLVQVHPIGIAEFALDWPISLACFTERILAALSEAGLVYGNHELARICGNETVEALQDPILGEGFLLHANHQMLYSL